MNYEPIKTSVRGYGISDEDWNDDITGCDCDYECSSNSNCSCLINKEQNYSQDGKIVNPLTSKPILECHSQCSCVLLPSKCGNRIVQSGIVKKLEVFSTDSKGAGVKTLETIYCGEFVCEYAGEYINEEEVERRSKWKTDNNYTLTIKEHYGGEVQKTFIDPRLKGNVGRFLNHSCDPNCEIVIVRIGRMVPTIGLFAKRKIEVGEELTYDYGESSTNGQFLKKCFCLSKNCRQFLPMSISPIE